MVLSKPLGVTYVIRCLLMASGIYLLLLVNISINPEKGGKKN